MPSAHGQHSEAEHRQYFERQLESTAEFWRRFGVRPDFRDKLVLDLGCGHGAMSIDAAGDGATVLGVDLDADRVAFAQRNVETHFPALRERLEFRTVDIVAAPDSSQFRRFDFVLSKDTFEHVVDVEAMLSAIFALLKPGGELWAGFSPLFWSPRGDHGRTGLRLPWAHAFLPRPMVLAAATRFNKRPIAKLNDIELNGITSPEFFRYADNSGLHVSSALFNRGGKPLMSTLSRVRRITPLERYATIGIYTVMQRPA
jgi:SAM-dependent methyltransferase